MQDKVEVTGKLLDLRMMTCGTAVFDGQRVILVDCVEKNIGKIGFNSHHIVLIDRFYDFTVRLRQAWTRAVSCGCEKGFNK